MVGNIYLYRGFMLSEDKTKGSVVYFETKESAKDSGAIGISKVKCKVEFSNYKVIGEK